MEGRPVCQNEKKGVDEKDKLESIHQTTNLLFKAAVIIQSDVGQSQ